ncbi:MAG TPA: aldehyde reductase [Caulobacteraceae bacterium]|nr:aldehyde reductase [Caulobacteraceae bacterium]
MAKVLVTGGSGFIGSHCIIQLLEQGHSVRTTVRNLAREGEVRGMLERGGAKPGKRLTFFAADLMSDAGWAQAVAGCDYVLHVASPFPAATPRHEDELIVPAREGALRVLRAARDAGVKRVVLTSSYAAIGYGHPERARPFDESDWTNIETPGIGAYVKSKAIAEKAAWDFIARAGGALELAVVNPVAVLGPVLAPDYSTSILLVQKLMEGALPAAPKASFGIVDVRDVADLHIRAMTDPAARGERFLAMAGESMSILETGRVLRERFGPAASKVPTRELPNWLVRVMALVSQDARALLPQLGRRMNADVTKARRLLGWQPRSNEDAIAATAESLMQLGLAPQPEKAAA